MQSASRNVGSGSCFLFPLEQNNGIGRHSFFTSGKAEFFCSRGFDRYVFYFNIHKGSKNFLHLGNMRIDFGTFCADCGIYIADFPSFTLYQFGGLAQQDFTIDAFQRRI